MSPRSHCRSSRLSAVLLPAAATALLLAPTTTRAATKTWTNPAGGTWSNPANWSPSLPTSSDTALFDLGPAAPAYTVAIPTSIFNPISVAVRNDTLALTSTLPVVLSFSGLTLAGAADQNASLTVTGGEFDFNNATLASAGSATLNVSPDTTLLTHFALSSGAAGGSATVNVAGAGARLEASTVQLGTAGPAALNVTAGGVATSPNGVATFAGASGGSAAATVDGSGSLLSAYTLQLAAGYASPVQSPTSATLVARNGARVAAHDLSAGASGAAAYISLDGPGTTLSVGSSISVGFNGASASLSLTNGATLAGDPNFPGSAAALFVGTSIGGATGSAAVSVSSGSLLNSGTATVGAGSSVTVSSDTASPSKWNASSLTLSAGATATIATGGQLATDRLTGDGTLRLAGGVASVGNSFGFRGTLAGAGSASGFNISPSFTFAPDGTLDFSYGSPGSHSTLPLVLSTRINLDITSPSTYDRLTTPNTVRYLGTLAVSLDPSYTPAAGDAFDLLDAYARSGTSTFTTLSLPPLPPGLTWDTSALYTTGTLAITVPEPTSLLAACALALPLLTHRRTKS